MADALCRLFASTEGVKLAAVLGFFSSLFFSPYASLSSQNFLFINETILRVQQLLPSSHMSPCTRGHKVASREIQAPEYDEMSSAS